MKKIAVFLVLTVMMIASCSNREKQYVIGVSQCSDDSWRQQFNDELKLCTFLHDNYSLEFRFANDSDELQVRQINELIDRGADLLIVAPNKLTTINPAIERAHKLGIPVILFDRTADTPYYTASIGADNEEIGYHMARYLAFQMEEKGRVVEIEGLDGSSAAIERHKGFVREMQKYPGIEIIATLHCNWKEDSARKVMAQFLDKATPFDAVFAHNDRMALGARKAVEAKGLTNHVFYVGVDALPDKGGGLELVSQGVLDGSYIYPTRGYLVAQLASDILEGKPYNRENKLRGTHVTLYNADALRLQREEIYKQRSQLYELHSRVNQYLAQYSHQRVYVILASIIILILVVSIVIIYRLISSKRRLAEQAAEAKLNYFIDAFHEFRTPLTLIADPLDRVFTDKTLDEDQRLDLGRLARRNIGVALQMVNQTLDFRKYQEGKMHLVLSRFDLSHEVSMIMEGFKPACDSKEIDLRLQADSELTIVADKNMVDRTIYNLLGNAIKFTPRGGQIEIVLARKDEGKISIRVIDNGKGMSKHDMDHIFERFYQGEGSRGGSGIGMSLVKMFIEMHHGEVTVDSQLGHGTTFTIIIPCKQEGEITTADEETEKPIVPISCEQSFHTIEPTAADRATNINEDSLLSDKPTLLIVDDNDDMRSYLSMILSADYRVLHAIDGQMGIDRALKEVPDIIVSDVVMPVVDGFQLCRRLKSERATSHIPIIMLTACSHDDSRTDAYNCGADAYIAKPFSSQVLLSRVKNLLDNRRQLRSLYGLNETVDVKASDTDSQFIYDFNHCVLQNMGDSTFGVDQLSHELGLSRAQVYRKIKALTGCSPVELIRKTRLKRADQLLKSGGRTVSEVLYEVGFTSSSYFAKCFKEEFGRLPSE